MNMDFQLNEEQKMLVDLADRMLRDVRMFQIGGGTSQAQLNMIARSIFPAR